MVVMILYPLYTKTHSRMMHTTIKIVLTVFRFFKKFAFLYVPVQTGMYFYYTAFSEKEKPLLQQTLQQGQKFRTFRKNPHAL